MENKYNLENVPEETLKVLFIYRQNDFYDTINKSLKEKYGERVYSIVLPKETQNLNETDSSNLIKFIEHTKEKNPGRKVLCDDTIPKMLDNLKWLKMCSLYKSVIIPDANRKVTSPESYLLTLKEIAKRSKELGAENILISLIGLYEGNKFLGGYDIDAHGLTIKDRKGKEINQPISKGNIQETFNFLKTPFEKYGIKPVPTYYDSVFGEVVPLKDCSFQTLEGKVLKIPETNNLNTDKSVVLADRHQFKIDKNNFKAIFYKNENSLLQEISENFDEKEHQKFYSPFEFGQNNLVEKVIETIDEKFFY